jgi:mannose-6-phosphate isomerase-like protein (cupin superfamily)
MNDLLEKTANAGETCTDKANGAKPSSDNGFITPPGHVNFSAKKLFTGMGQIIDGSIARLGKKGGGPTELHTHAHNHLFIVVKGEAKVQYLDREVIIKENESYLVDGETPHSVWNNGAEPAIMIGLSVK